MCVICVQTSRLIGDERSNEYDEYVAKHGLHFNSSLADYAVSIMRSEPLQSSSKLSEEDIAQTIKGKKFRHKVTTPDIVFGTNMYIADFYPTVITTEAACLKAAEAIADDEDGYEGQLFCRWVADMQHKGVCIEWGKYI